MHSLKYVVGRHWLRAHMRFVAICAVVAAVIVYAVAR